MMSDPNPSPAVYDSQLDVDAEPGPEVEPGHDIEPGVPGVDELEDRLWGIEDAMATLQDGDLEAAATAIEALEADVSADVHAEGSPDVGADTEDPV